MFISQLCYEPHIASKFRGKRNKEREPLVEKVFFFSVWILNDHIWGQNRTILTFCRRNGNIKIPVFYGSVFMHCLTCSSLSVPLGSDKCELSSIVFSTSFKCNPCIDDSKPTTELLYLNCDSPIICRYIISKNDQWSDRFLYFQHL